jgi:hypothetical protein
MGDLVAELSRLGVFNEDDPLLVGPNRAAEILEVSSSNMPRFRDRLHVLVVEGSSAVYVKAEVEALAVKRAEDKAERERKKIEREEQKAARAKERADRASEAAAAARKKAGT